MPSSFAQSFMHIVFPLCSIIRTCLLFLACSPTEAHRQLLGSYPMPLSMRSIVVPGGRSPMSARKFSNSAHRAHTLMPFAPYLWYASLLGSLQRISIARHVIYVGVFLPTLACPCRSIAECRFSSQRQPQDLVLPLLNASPRTFRTVP